MWAIPAESDYPKGKREKERKKDRGTKSLFLSDAHANEQIGFLQWPSKKTMDS